MQLKNKKQKFISLKEAEAIFGYASDYIGYLIRKGKIPGRKIYSGGKWKVSRRAILDFISKKHKKISHRKKWIDWVENQYISLKEAAKISGYTSDYIGYLIREGKVPGKKIYSNINWVTTEEAIIQYQRSKIKKQKVLREVRLPSLSPLTHFWRKGFYFSLKVPKPAIIFTVLGIIVFGGLIALAVAPETQIQTIEIYSTKYAGDWQNPQNIKGSPQVGPVADLNSFSEANSAVYQGGSLSLIISGFNKTQTDLTTETEEEPRIEQPLIEESLEEELPTEEESEQILDGEELTPAEESQPPAEEAVQEELSEEEPQQEELQQEEQPYLEESEQQEETIQEEIINEIQTESNNEIQIEPLELESPPSESPPSESPPSEGEPTSFLETLQGLWVKSKTQITKLTKNLGEFTRKVVKAQEVPAFEELINKNEFISAKIKFSFAVGEKTIDLGPPQIEETTPEIIGSEEGMPGEELQVEEPAEELEVGSSGEEETEQPIEGEPTGFWNKTKDFFRVLISTRTVLVVLAEERGEEEVLPNIDAKIIIWYSLNGENPEGEPSAPYGAGWQKLDTISNYPLSNALNGDYFSYDAPFLENWDDVKNLKIKFEGVVGGETIVVAYLDSLWVEVDYQEKEEKEYELRALKKDWRADEEPVFEIVSKKEENIVEKLLGQVSSVFEAEPKIQAGLVKPNNEILSLRPGENFIAETRSPTKIIISRPEDFRPGLHKLKVDFEKDDKIYNLEEDFTWGVLAINLNKSIYVASTPRETDAKLERETDAKQGDEIAYIQMAALDEEGHTICDADLMLEIIPPSGEPSSVPVERSGECGPNNVTNVPDYFAYYQVSEPGIYEMKLTRLTQVGPVSIEDYFEVRESVPFEVERIGPTRIYPVAAYQMILKIKTNEDFKGEVIEQIPASFELTGAELTQNNTQNNAEDFSVNQRLDQRESASIVTEDGTKQIIWNVAWKKGEEYELKYQFDAPDISPYLYLLGPLSFYESSLSKTLIDKIKEGIEGVAENIEEGVKNLFGNELTEIGSLSNEISQASDLKFQEARQWQIASDATLTKFPSLGESISEAPWSDNAWVTPTNIYADDAATAYVNIATFDTGDQTYVLKATGFDFSAIPDGSTINGVTVRVNSWYRAGEGSGSMDLLQLLNTSKAKVGTNQCATPVALTTTDTTIITKGSPTNLWGNALTAAWVKNANFGVAIGILATAENADVDVDYVTIEIDYTPPSPPSTPTNLTQYKSDHSTTIPTGSWVSDGVTTNIYLDMTMSSPNATDTLTPQVEVQPLGTDFTGTANFTGTAVAYSGTPVTGSVTVSGLKNDKEYHWQARVSGNSGQSSWVSYGANLETERDFGVDIVAPGPGTTATQVIGHPNFTRIGDNDMDGGTLYNPYSTHLDANGKFFVADYNNNRVLIYNSVPTSNGQAANMVLGQADMESREPNRGGSVAANTLNQPWGIFSDGTKLYVADYNNHRVLIWNTIPIANGVAADVVVGQADMISGSANQGGSVAANTLNKPRGIWSNGTKLIIADCNNNRVLIYNTVPTTNNASANVVVGQADFLSNSANQGATPAANTLYNPWGIHSDGTKLYVADYLNHRTLIYNTIPTTNNASANVVVGQADFLSNSANQGGAVAANTLKNPSGVSASGTKLYIADGYNHRILIYDPIPTANNASASVVVGQTDMISSASGTSATLLKYPRNVFSNGTKLFITDCNNHRALIYNSIPASNGAAADVVVGHSSMTRKGENDMDGSTIRRAYSTFVDVNGKFFVVDRENNRILIYNSVPTSNEAPADVVVGQPDMETNSYGTSATNLYSPRGVYSDGTKLYVVDHVNHRVLIWNTIPTTNGAAADVVVGQIDMTSGSANQGGVVAANTLYYPNRVLTDGTKLYIADEWNNRILIYNAIPITNNASADVVVGQTSMTTNTSGTTSTTLNMPHGLWIKDGKLYIADTDNNRTLIYNSIPTTNGAAADVVVGQANMTSGSANQGGTVAANTLSSPSSVNTDDGIKLFIADSNNHRILIYNSIPTTNNASADVVVGQANFTSNTKNRGGSPAADTLWYPTSIFAKGARNFVADHNNNRALIYAFNLSSPANNSSTTNTSPTFSWYGALDSESGLAKYQLWIDGVLDKDNIDPATTSTTPTNPLSVGPHTWYVKTIDNAGNIRQSPSTWTINILPSVITVSGTCRQYDQTTNCADAETVRVAVNATLQAQTGSTSTGSWSITGVTPPVTGDVITIFIAGVLDTNEAVAVTKYDGTGNITGVNLYERHLTIGSDDLQTITNANLSQYDNSVSANEDIFHDVDVSNNLSACAITGCTDVEIWIKAGNTWQAAAAGGTTNTTHDIEINGTLTADSNTIKVSGSWDNNSVFNAGTGTVIFTATAGTETIDSTGATTASFNNLTLGETSGTATWNLASSLDVNGNLLIDFGTLSNGANNITLAGNLTINANGIYTAGSGTFTFDGSGTNTWTDNTTTKQNLGTVTIDGTTKTINLGSSVTVTKLTTGADDTLGLGSLGYTLKITGSGQGVSRPFIVTTGGTLNEGTNSTIEFTGTATTDVEAETYNNLKVNSTGVTFYPYNNITASGVFTIAAGTFNGSFYIITLSGTGTPFVISGTFTPSTSTVRYTGNGATNITVTTYYLLSIGAANSANITYTAAGDITANFQVDVNSAAVGYINTFAMSTYNLTVGLSTVTNSGWIWLYTRAAFTQSGGTTTIRSSNGGYAQLGGSFENVSLTFYNLKIGETGDNLSYNVILDHDITVSNDLTITDGGTGTHTFDVSPNNYGVTVGGSWDNNDTFLRRAGTVTFNASTGTKTIYDGGSPFYALVFNNTATFTYTDEGTPAGSPTNSTSVSNGTVTFINARTGTVTVTGGTLYVDWYLGVHVVDAANTATNIDTGDADITISENSATPQATVWRHDGTSWGTAATSQTTGTGADGKNPQPFTAGAIRIREYSMTASATCPGAGCTLYRYNLQITWQSNYGEYNYYEDYGNKYLTSTLNTGSGHDEVISGSWHRPIPGTMNTVGTVNEPPTNGSWYVGMITGLSFSIDDFSVDIPELNVGNNFTATATNTLTVTTSATNGYVITAWSTNDARLKLQGLEVYINKYNATNISPKEWDQTCSSNSNCCGFGYTTNDSSLSGDGLTRFTTGTATCSGAAAGGVSAYAGFALSGSGDPVANRSSTECPCINQQNIITYKVSTSVIQTIGKYETVVIYIATAQY